MFNFIKRKITERRMKKIRESAFPVMDDHCHNWFSDWFSITDGAYSPRYFTVMPILTSNIRLRHGDLINKYTLNGIDAQLIDSSNNFRRLLSFDWKDFKKYDTRTYNQLKNNFTVLQIWDKMLDCPINRFMLEAGAHIKTPSWNVDEDYSLIWLTPKLAEQLFNALDTKLGTLSETDKEIVARYKDYILTKFAEITDPDTLSASQPELLFDTFSARRKTIIKQMEDEIETQKLSIIKMIKDKKSNL